MNLSQFIRCLNLLPSYIFEICNLIIFYRYARRKYAKENIILISERGMDARDNGFHLFKYIRTKYPHKKIYFIINKSSEDIKNVQPYGNVIFSNTLQHRLMFYGAKFLISTHLMGGYTTNQSFYMHFNKHLWFRKNRKVISIKHGITKDDLPVLYKENAELDLLICGAPVEYEYITQNFHYKNNEVQYTGFARFDKLGEHKEHNQILLMPTWRQYLAKLSGTEFEQSIYFSMWNQVLQNNELNQFLKEKNLKLIFYPHYEMQPYLSFFYTDNPKIIIAAKKDYDVQQLLMESKLLITDYSSVFFDFAYMIKPVVYYQFDQETFFAKHYKKGYFNYENMGFGPVVNTASAVVNSIIELANRNFVPTIDYRKRMESFFPRRDNQNCERIYDAIRNICKM